MNKLLRFSMLSILSMLFVAVHADYYEKITTTEALTDGQYLIVYEDGNLAFNGGLETLDAASNTIEVSITDSKITASDATTAAEFTYTSNGKTLKSASGLYIGQTSDVNGLQAKAETAYQNNISFDDDGNAIISSSTAYLRYNATSGQTRFRYYKSSTYTNQKAIQLYKRAEEPSEATVTFDVTKAGAEGIAPAAQKVVAGSKVKIPANTTLYAEGKTLTAWTDGTNHYKVGDEVTVSADMALTPVFTENTISFTDRTAETTITWQFGEGNGVGTLNAQGKSTILVTQATIGEAVIDVKMDIDATNGKINNVGHGDKWAQCNDGTIMTIPAYKGMTVSFDSYLDGSGTTIGGVAATDKAATYDGTAETINIAAQSIGYIASLTAVYPVPSGEEPVKVDVNVAFSIEGAECLGQLVAEGGAYKSGDDFTLPAKNFTLYKEGYTQTGWTDGENTYEMGQVVSLPENDITFTPVFTANEVNLSDRTEAVTVKFNFQRQNGAPTVQWQNQDNLVWVAQAEVNGKTIDVKTDLSTNPGKFANGNWTDWAQLNNGTTFTVPSCKGATVSMEAYTDITTTTIDGQTDYTQGKAISYTVAGAAETVDIVIGDGSYYRYIQVVMPVVQSQGGGESYDNVEGTIAWAVGNEASGTVSANIASAVQNATYSAGSEMTITESTYFESTMVNYKPNTSNAGNVEGVMVEYRVKMAAGLTFKPSSVSYDCVKVGTDGATYSWGYVVDETASSITEVDAATTLRNNGANSSTAQLNHVLDMSNAGEGNVFAIRFYISKTANNKNICIGNVIITGTINGTIQNVNLYTLATAVAPEEAGSIYVYPAAEEYEEGTEVKLTATENFGYDFVNWTDGENNVVSEEPVFTYTMNGDATLTANFVAVETYELALTVDGTNDYMVTVSPEPTIVDGKMMYEAGQAVQLTANQYEGLVTFTNWSDGETSSSKLISMTEDIQFTAMYAQADIIAGWDFYTAGNSGRKADFYAQDNDADALNLVNTETGDASGWLDKSTLGGGGYESFKGAAVNWRTGTQNGDVGNWHWQTKVNAEAFTDINVQFQMLYNYNAYQTYDAEYSLDGEQWTKFGSITMSGAKVVASFSEQLPAEANNQAELYLRMKADKNSKVDGSASANDGNTLAMFFITGTPKLVDDGTAPVLVSCVPAKGATGVSATGKIVLTFDERVKVKEGAQASISSKPVSSDPADYTSLTPNVSGKTVTFEYKGLEYKTAYTFILSPNTIGDLTDNMMQDAITLTFTTMERPSVQKGLYDAVVENVDQLMAAITKAEARSDKNVRFRIFIKNGEYTIPLSSTMKTVNGYEVPECITFIKSGNISLIGESRDSVIITNGIDKQELFDGTYGKTSKYDGIGNSDVFQISGSDYYFQDLTIESGMDDATGRDLAIQDKATRTIYKNTGLRGFQDTWTSNNDNGLYYFEGGYVRGRTDYMCGKGDAFFNGVELRQIAGGYAAVPSKSIKYGYVYKDCVINGEPAVVKYDTGEKRTAAQADGNYTLGRPWGSGTPIALFIDTRMNVVPSAIGWNEMSGGWPKRFAEFNSTTKTGSVIDLSGRKKIFADTHENNPVLTAEEALEAGNLHNMFGDWDPTLATEQAPVPTNVKIEGTSMTWDNSNYALLWAIVKDGKVVDFTTEPLFTIDDKEAEWAVRAANEMGGLSDAVQANVTNGIESVSNAEQMTKNSNHVYNIHGIRVSKTQNGLYIINGKKVMVK